MEVECVYEKGVLRPLEKVGLRGGEKVRVSIKFYKKEMLENYAGIIKLRKKVRLGDILELGDDSWLH